MKDLTFALFEEIYFVFAYVLGSIFLLEARHSLVFPFLITILPALDIIRPRTFFNNWIRIMLPGKIKNISLSFITVSIEAHTFCKQKIQVAGKLYFNF